MLKKSFGGSLCSSSWKDCWWITLVIFDASTEKGFGKYLGLCVPQTSRIVKMMSLKRDLDIGTIKPSRHLVFSGEKWTFEGEWGLTAFSERFNSLDGSSVIGLLCRSLPNDVPVRVYVICILKGACYNNGLKVDSPSCGLEIGYHHYGSSLNCFTSLLNSLSLYVGYLALRINTWNLAVQVLRPCATSSPPENGSQRSCLRPIPCNPSPQTLLRIEELGDAGRGRAYCT